MKVSFKVLFLVIVSAMLISLSGCKKPNPVPPTVEEVQLGLLSQTWKIKTVKLDGADKTSGYTGFTLVLSGTPGSDSFKYTTNRPAGSTTPWLANGNWGFGIDPLKDITRDKGTADELLMKYDVTDNRLEIEFDFSGTGYQARTSVVKGKWFFEFQL